ncbi:hypothetical protein Pcinc_003618 [Petrolisthes cinctipes]|uniref:Uncharacterized protein n=1 Tax=Petrolisthes cinctipes TaxID=88211 RepID=A0AAE1GHG6_PETCI|nr:hypothetical protein Pcinc_003618 [Petrolisthes cinctipes]
MLVMVAAAAATQEADAHSPPQRPTDWKISNDDTDVGQGKFFFKSYSTRTRTVISSLVSTVPYTCFSNVQAVTATCGGGRKLRRSKLFIQDSPLDTKLYSSTGEEEPMPEEEKASEKFFFTIFRTLSSTATVTVFSTNRSVTVSVSLMCTETGATYNAITTSAGINRVMPRQAKPRQEVMVGRTDGWVGGVGKQGRLRKEEGKKEGVQERK